MIDSQLLCDFICHKISRSVGIIAKMRHYIPRHLLLNLYHALITPCLNYGICALGNCPQTYLSKLLTAKMCIAFDLLCQRPCNSFSYWIKLPSSTVFVLSTVKLFLNALDNEDNCLNVTLLIEYFKQSTWYFVYTSSCNFSLFFLVTKPLCLSLVRGFSFCVLLYSFPFFLKCNLITPLLIIFVLLGLSL